MSLRSHYENLKVARDAPPEVIRAAYRVLAQRYHPDLNQSPEAERIMKVINEAYAVLSDPQRRSEHDAWIDDQLSNESPDETLAEGCGQKANRHAPPPGASRKPFPDFSPPPSPSASSESTTGGSGWRGTKFVIWVIVSGALIGWLWTSGRFPRTDSGRLPAYGTPSVSVVAQTSNDTLLGLICDARNILGNTCSMAKGYPGREACDVELKETRAEGRFLSADSTILLVVYQSRCEPHAMNYGGSLLFEKRDAILLFKGYVQGLVVTDCTSSAIGKDQERLVCSMAGSGQGHLVTSISEIAFTRDTEKALKTSAIDLVSATDSLGAWGANPVECGATFKLFGVSSPKPGPTSNTVLVQARYMDADLIRTACAPDRKPPTDYLGAIESGMAYVEEDQIREDWLIMDLATRKLAKAPAPQPAPPLLKTAENTAGARGQYVTNGDGQRVVVKTPTCRDAQQTQLMEWGGDFYNAWCIDRESMTRRMDTSGGIALTGVYERVADKIIFWRGAQDRPCTRGHLNFVELFKALHAFYEHHPQLIYRDLDEGIRPFVMTAESCK